MKLKVKLSSLLRGSIPDSLLPFLPSGYSLIGDILILRLSDPILPYAKIIANSLLSLEPRAHVVVQQFDTVDTFRHPVIRHLSGENRTTTLHTEFRTKFLLDIAKITFSPGNKQERGRLIRLVNDGEVVCDMFACVGNLSLPLALNHQNLEVIAIEKNPVAFDFLLHNIALNSLEDRCRAILGDNRDVTPRSVASRVIMGFFHIDDTQLLRAIQALDNKGWLHYHVLSRRGEEVEIKECVLKKIESFGADVVEYHFRRVKKFSPSKTHACIDIYLKNVG